MSTIELGIVAVLSLQVVHIVYLSAIWNRLLDWEHGRSRFDVPPPIDRSVNRWWRRV